LDWNDGIKRLRYGLPLLFVHTRIIRLQWGLKKPHEYIYTYYVHVWTRCYILYTDTDTYTNITHINITQIYTCVTLECGRVDAFEMYTFLFRFSTPALHCFRVFLSIPFYTASYCVFIIITIVIGVLWRLITCWIIITIIHTHTQTSAV